MDAGIRKRNWITPLCAFAIAVVVAVSLETPAEAFAASALAAGGSSQSQLHVQRQKRVIAKAKVKGVKKSYTYTGKALKPKITVTLKGRKLVPGADYKVSYKKNKTPGTAKITVRGKGAYKGAKTVKFKIAKAPISKATVSKVGAQPYTGKQVKPQVKVTYKEKELKPGRDYTITYANNVKPGKATITLKGRRYFKGARQSLFTIAKKENRSNDDNAQSGTGSKNQKEKGDTGEHDGDNQQAATKSHTIKYMPNGGAGTMQDTSVSYARGLGKLAANAFERSGYHFTCWNTNPDGSGTAYLNSDYINMMNLGDTVTLYAQWAKDYEARYSYQVYKMPSEVSDFYTNNENLVFIKTDNPDRSKVRLICDGKFADSSSRIRYRDILYSDDDTKVNVAGGYIARLSVSDAGNRTFEVLEYSSDAETAYSYDESRKGVDFSVAGSFSLNFVDTNEAYGKWRDGVISSCCTSGMNPKEKMDAVESYLWSHEGFRYLTSSKTNGALYYYAAHPNGPFFVVKRWDSYTSPAVLCDFAKTIGGFDEVHNCYGDYARGTSGWYAYHYMCRVTYGGEQYYYEACPMTESGALDDYKIDLSDTSKLRRLV